MKRIFFVGILLFISSVLITQDAAETITIAGTIQSIVGCPGDWQPECGLTHMSYDDDADLWRAEYDLPAGRYEVKVAYNGTWAVNYGLNGEPSGPNIPFTLDEDATITFTYSSRDHILHITSGGQSLQEEAPAQSDGEEHVSTSNPDIVNIPGTIQTVLGCDGEWQPECGATFLDYDEVGDVWVRTFDVPAGDYEYKIALNGSWEENYGGTADAGGPNIILAVAEDKAITFIYDHKTHLIVDNVRSLIITVPGSYQSEIGCSDDWLPDCLLSLLQDVDGDGLYTMTTNDIPAGDYEVKAAINLSWDENYGEDGTMDGANIPFTVENDRDAVTFAYNPEDNTLSIVTGGNANISAGDLTRSRAYWLTADTIAWDVDDNLQYQLLYSADASIKISIFGLEGNYETIDLTINDTGLSDDIVAKFPHLARLTALKVPDVDRVPDLLRGQNYIVSVADGEIQSITGLQIPGVLDDLYTYKGDLGISIEDNVPTLRVWAPTAQQVNFVLYNEASRSSVGQRFEMENDDTTGVWIVTGEPDWMNKYYHYEVLVYAPTTRALETNLVTDPYSISLSANSLYSQIVDLNDPQWMPDDWVELEKPPLSTPEDIVLYELHIRDFSIFDETVLEDLRGTYMAFTVEDSNGMKHLSALAEAGLTHIHLMPTFDIATIIENRKRQFTPDYDLLADLAADSDEQQAELDQFRDLDGFNWGYDPFHYNTPEGSYTTDPNSPVRLLEFREMVKALNEIGLRVVMDVVYNHTNASGQSRRSVLDRTVPGYYHRLDASGNVTRSTCCENTATEHNMMRKLMIDSVVLYATAYKIDGYRFDLMGHHMLDDMIAVRNTLDNLTYSSNGVDGKRIYVYGEGWDFGEVSGNARGINATQLNIAGTGIGVFNDRLRDAARGGNPFGGWQDQGFVNGLYVDPNGFTEGDEDTQQLRALHFADQIRVGLAGNLMDYTFEGTSDEIITGKDVDYNGSPAGYTVDPQENVVYISAHDNETLWDAITYKAPSKATVEDRVRMQNLGISLVGYAQGIPFYHAGIDMLRSKSMDRNSYNSGDWFNRLDFTYEHNNFGVGLPPASDNGNTWDLQQPLLKRNDIIPAKKDILSSVAHTREVLAIRNSSPLFHLQTAEEIQNRLAFHNTGADQVPGLIIMSLSDLEQEDLDPNHTLIVVVFNGNPNAVEFIADAVAGFDLQLHSLQAKSQDIVVKRSKFDADSGTFNIPGYTTAVFVLPQG